jgi:hypothetical protein
MNLYIKSTKNYFLLLGGLLSLLPPEGLPSFLLGQFGLGLLNLGLELLIFMIFNFLLLNANIQHYLDSIGLSDCLNLLVMGHL